MDYNTFEEKIINKLQEIVGDSACVQAGDVVKNNNIRQRGMTILRKGQDISPTIYLSSFYKMINDGMDLESVAKLILKIYVRALPQGKTDLEFFKDYEQVKDKIIYHLVNPEKNKELLEDIPHVDFMGLAICFYYCYLHPEIGEGMILIHNSHIEMWNVGVKELMENAKVNTPQLMPVQLTSIHDALIGQLDESVLDEIRQYQKDKNSYLYVLSNPRNYLGAAVILYPGILAQIAEQLGGSYYVFPFTVNEVILMLDGRNYSREKLHKMIVEINQKRKRKEDVLYEYAYYYDARKEELVEVR